MTLAMLAIAVLSTLSVWAWLNRPVAMPDYRGPISGFAFSPFRAGQSPETGVEPSAAQIRRDLVLIARYTRGIRTYTVAGIQGRIPELARGLPLSITLGAWIDSHLRANEAEISRLIRIANANPNVTEILVGNETILRHDVSIDRLIGYIQEVKKDVHVPVSTAEPWHVWLHHPELAQAVDFITVHLLPYWEGVPVTDALNVTLQRLEEVEAAFPGKNVVVGEVGWPSNGVTIGGAYASRVNQALFLRRFFAAALQDGLDYFVMEAFDQPWKTSFEGRAAGYWGMFTLGRQKKWPFTGPVENNPAWLLWSASSIGIAFFLAWGLLSRRPDIRPAGKLLLALLTQGFVATLAAVLMTMGETYLSLPAALVWGILAFGQLILLFSLLGGAFELSETVWGKVRRRLYRPLPAPPGAELPKVSIHIPVCNEPPEMVRQTLAALAAQDYPDFEVLVIDNNTTDPALWQPLAAYCAEFGPRFRFFHLGSWPGFKAGALNFALRETAADAEIVGVLDSDYVVRPDWLRSMVPAFADPAVGFVQSPQDYRDHDGSLFKRLMFWEYAGFFHLGMTTRNERNAIIQHGTMTLIRKAALAGSGGWAEWTITEDAELGLRLFCRGWLALYAPQSFGRGVMPDDFAAYRKQRHRWAFGAMQISRTYWRSLLWPFSRELSPGQRWHFVTGWLPWVGDALGLLFLALGLLWSVGLILDPMRFEFPIVLFMLPSLGLFLFKLVQLFLLYRARVPCGVGDRVGAAVAGLALSHTIGKAVWKGLLTTGAPFLCTPKMKNAPALVRALVMVREELAILIAAWAAAAGVAWAHQLATLESQLWCFVLLVQSLPYLAAVAVSLLAALPARAPARTAAALPALPELVSGRSAA